MGDGVLVPGLQLFRLIGRVVDALRHPGRPRRCKLCERWTTRTIGPRDRRLALCVFCAETERGLALTRLGNLLDQLDRRSRS